MRFTPGAVLPVPPVVSQLHALGPDGVPDEAAASDCGEACVASVLTVHTSYLLAPGCVRQALGKPRVSGLTTAGDLSGVLRGFGVDSWIRTEPAHVWDDMARLRHFGRYVLVLGHWLQPSLLHWMLAYERDRDDLLCMDPWRANLIRMSAMEYETQDSGTSVVARLS